MSTKTRASGIILLILSTVATLAVVFAYGPRSATDAWQYLLSDPLNTPVYISVALIYAAFHQGALWLVVTLTGFVAAVALITRNKAVSSSTRVVPVSSAKEFRFIDAFYLLSATPLILTVIHEYVVCNFVPALGVHGGDTSSQCTIGWGILFIMLFIPVWIVLSLTVAPLRLHALYTLKGTKSIMFWFYLLSLIGPIPLVVEFFLR
mgnify:CR=1 FL=1